MILETNRDTPTAPTSDEKWWWRHLYIGKMICTSWWRGVMEIGKTYGFLRFVTCLRVANLPTYFHHKHLRNTSMLFWGQNCQAPESTSNTTKMAIPLYGGGWTTRFAKILWTRPKGESFSQFSDWKVEHVFFAKKTPLRKALLWWKVASSPWVAGIPLPLDWTKHPDWCILKRWIPPRPQKINQMNSCHPSDNCFRKNFASPKSVFYVYRYT